MSGKRKGRGVDAKGRSKRDGKHVRHYEYVLACPAYRSLSLASRCLLTELHRLYRGDNNGELYLSVRRAAGLLAINPKTALKAFHEIEGRGFIKPKQRGAFSLKVKHATAWILTEFEHGGEAPMKDFMRWRPSNKETCTPVEKHKSVPLRGTLGTPTRNAVPLRGTDNPPLGTPTRNRDGPNGTSLGTPTRNTDSLPGGARGNGSADTSEPACGPHYPPDAIINGVRCAYGVLFDRDYLPSPSAQSSASAKNGSAGARRERNSTAWPADGYTMTGYELEALCKATGRSLKGFARIIGFDARKLRRKTPIGFAEDPMACAQIDGMRAECEAGER